jgi:hypothetical protein
MDNLDEEVLGMPRIEWTSSMRRYFVMWRKSCIGVYRHARWGRVRL